MVVLPSGACPMFSSRLALFSKSFSAGLALLFRQPLRNQELLRLFRDESFADTASFFTHLDGVQQELLRSTVV